MKLRFLFCRCFVFLLFLARLLLGIQFLLGKAKNEKVDIWDLILTLKDLPLHKVIPKVKRMNSWLRSSWCNSLSQLKLQLVDSLTFQAKYWNERSLIFLRTIFYPIKTWFRHQNKFLFHLEKWLFSNHSYPTTKSDFY